MVVRTGYSDTSEYYCRNIEMSIELGSRHDELISDIAMHDGRVGTNRWKATTQSLHHAMVDYCETEG